MNRKAYIITEKAGRWVAGQRRPIDGRLMLTDSQAAYELALGTIRPEEAGRAPARRRRSRKRKD